MAGTTSIEWTATVNADGSVTPGKTWNPTRGCSRVSSGCTSCYAEKLAGRYSAYGAKPDSPFAGFVTKVNGHASWTGKVELIESMLDAPLRWKKPCRIFVNSMSDLFHEALPAEDIRKVLWVIAECSRRGMGHTFQVLTKRPLRMREIMDEVMDVADLGNWTWSGSGGSILDNLWLGVSVEDQETADERIPLLLQTPAAIRFISYEPALGAADLRRFLPMPRPYHFSDCPCLDCFRRRISLGLRSISTYLDWVIVGGESGPGARPFYVDWARNTVEQCGIAGVPVFVKQVGLFPNGSGFPADFDHRKRDRKGGNMEEWPPEIRVRQFPQVRQ